ncbi:uncharacterized protein LOC142630426 isoform X1 [Castanea sativa]|uniref:uncharacterized protein LOC142630426 isoform X1 n=2 Tax=Castanea sativa TaxID=21020 RepID=UPI003F64FD28
MSQTSIKVYSEMGLLKFPLVVLLCSVFSLLGFIVLCDDSELTVKFLKTPHAFSKLKSTIFVFEVLVGGGGTCTNCNITCKLDDGIASNCESRMVSYAGLQDGNHTFEVCTNGSQGVGCGSYNWTVDTVPPTAYITTSTPFTNALNVSINISFSEPCTGPTGGGSFACSSVSDCNLLVYGAGQVIPSSLNILRPNLQYSVLVGLSSTAQYGRVILAMDNNFCTDSAGNRFTRNPNSTFHVHFDRRSMFVNFTTHVPERLLQLNGETRLVRATNSCIKLRVCLTFPEPVLNSSAEILNSLKVQILYALQLSRGTLLPLAVSKQHPGHRRFEYKAATCISDMAIVTVNINSTIICISGTPVSPVEPITFLYDSLRPAVMLSRPRSESLRPAVMLSTQSHIRTREHNIPLLIKFVKPVFGVNSSILSITGGNIQSFKEISSRIYAVEIKAENDSVYCVSVYVPENVIGDVAGNKNLRSNDLQLCPYHVPKISSVVSVLATASFVVTAVAAGLLTVSIASLSSIGAFSTPSSSFSNPARNLFRSACHIQVFALSRWLAVKLPVNYYEFARGLQWSIPYFSLPWESGHIQPVVVGSSPLTNSDSYRSKIHDSGIFLGVQPKLGNLSRAASIYKAQLRPNPKEYISLFQNNSKPDAEYILDGWEDFRRTMFWLAIIGGSLILLHALLLAILKFRKQKQSGYGLLTFPRFEIFLVNLALPSICEASSALIRGGTSSGIVVGSLFLGAVSFLLLALLWFLSTRNTFAKQLQYEKDHQAGWRFYNLGNRGQWTWKSERISNGLIILGPLFEDIRGPILSQISGERVDTNGDEIIASNEETEELCPKTEEVSGNNVVITSGTRLDLAPPSSARSTSHSTQPSCIPSTRSPIAATVVDSLTSSTSVYTHGDDGIIAFDGETEELCPKAEEVSGGSVVRTSGTRTDSAPPSSARSTSRSTQPSPIPSTRSCTAATLAGSLTSSSSVHPHVDDGIIASDYKTEEVYQKAEDLEVLEGSVQTHSEAPFNQKLFGKLRFYYTLLESLRRVVLGTMTGVYKDHWPSQIPTIILLCITSFQLLFLVLNKPFINKGVQLVEIVSVSSEVFVFAICLVLLETPSAAHDETIVGVFMLIIFLLGFLPQIMHQWYALQRQIKQLDSNKRKRFLTGLKIVSIGLALLFISRDILDSVFPGIFGDGDQGLEEDNVNIDDQRKEETNDTGDQAKEETNDKDDKDDEGEEETNRRNSGSSNRRNPRRRNRNRNSGSRNSGTTVPEKSWLSQLVNPVMNCIGLPEML